MRLDRVGQLEQEPAPLGGRHSAPGRKGAAGSGDGTVNVRFAGFRHPSERRAVMRIRIGKGGAVERVDEVAVDEELVGTPDAR
jgi:hypothetical protein